MTIKALFSSEMLSGCWDSRGSVKITGRRHKVNVMRVLTLPVLLWSTFSCSFRKCIKKYCQ